MTDKHGTYEDAVTFALEIHDDRLQTFEFLDAWSHGELDEWPEYTAWLASRRALSAPAPAVEQTEGAVTQVDRLRELLVHGWYQPGESHPILSADADRWIKEVRELGLSLLAARDEGHKAIPREPTPEMIEAAASVDLEGDFAEVTVATWRAMYAAALASDPAGQPVEDDAK